MGTPHLDAVSDAAAACLEGCRRISYNLNHKRLQVDLDNGTTLPFHRLSDGQRSLMVLAADLAWRTAQLNPQLGRRAPEATAGVVLIDEIELHLHPAWQRTVIKNLRSTFPRIQFVITTHSPQVIAGTGADSLRLLTDAAVHGVQYVEGREHYAASHLTR